MQALPNSELPRTKRNACVVCRKRKMGCDGARPGCANCTKSGQQCSYEPTRRRSGPRRGYVKQLEARLAEVEKQLTTEPKSMEPSLSPSLLFSGVADYSTAMSESLLGMNGLDTTYSLPAQGPEVFGKPLGEQNDYVSADFSRYVAMGSNPSRSNSDSYTPPLSATNSSGCPLSNTPADGQLYVTGMQEPLPPQEVISELEDQYFSTLHQFYPIIHRGRYLASSHLPYGHCPPCCLRYMIWAIAASTMPKYEEHKMIFYGRAKSYVEKSELENCGKGMLSVGYLQSLVLMCVFEYKHMLMGRAWMSSGKASRLSVMLSYSRIDLEDADGVKKIGPDAKDFIELEERRRAFWGAYSCDRFASMGTGWAVSTDDADIATNLPCDEAAWDAGIEVTTPKLEDCYYIKSDTLSTFAGHIFSVSLFNKVLQHLHRPRKENLADINDSFWKRHSKLDELLGFVKQSLPSHLRLPGASNTPAVIFLNLSIQTLHQTAVQKARDLGFDHSMIRTAKHKCMDAAAQTTTMVRMYGSQGKQFTHPFNVFHVYVASRVYLQALYDNPMDKVAQGSLELLMQYLEDEKLSNDLAGALLNYLKDDMENAMDGKKEGAKTHVNAFPPCKMPEVPVESFGSEESFTEKDYFADSIGMQRETDMQKPSAFSRSDKPTYGNDMASEVATPFAHSSSGSGGSPHSFSPKEDSTPLEFEKGNPIIFGQDDLDTFLNLGEHSETDVDMMFKGGYLYPT